MEVRESAVADRVPAGLMSATDRLRLVIDASPRQLAAVDRILLGREEPAPEPPRGPLLLNGTHAVELSGLSRTTLWRLVVQGVLPRVEILPGTFRYRRADLEALARGEKPAHSCCGRCSAAGGAE